MKILQIGKFFPPENGGIEQVTLSIAEGLSAKNISNDVICFTRSTSCQDQFSGYSVFRHRSQIEVLSTPLSTSFWSQLKKFITDSDYDLLHLHCPNPGPTLQLLLSFHSIPYIVHWHSDIVRYGAIAKIYRLFEHRLLRNADAIICTSKKYAEASATLRPHLEKVAIIPIGIDQTSLTPNALITASIQQRFSGKRIIFSLGRLIYYKGFDVLIRAATRLPDDHVVLIGGTGPLSNELQNLIDELNLGKKVFLLGKIEENELASHYEACSIFCLPSIERSEAFGVVLLEAMAMSKPIVATSIPGSAVDWVNQHDVSGLNVPPKDEVSLADAICKISKDKILYERLSKGGRNRFDNFFKRETMISRTIEIYNNVLTRNQIVL